MTLHEYRQEEWLPAGRAQVFSFFADTPNLEAITPPWLKFEILTRGEIEMRPVALIDYRLRWHRLPLRWQTEITRWEPGRGSVDEQRRGPYRFWQHTHTFSDLDGGTVCRNEVRYAVTGGRFVNWLLVRCDIEKFFAYRAGVLRRRFAPGG